MNVSKKKINQFIDKNNVTGFSLTIIFIPDHEDDQE